MVSKFSIHNGQAYFRKNLRFFFKKSEIKQKKLQNLNQKTHEHQAGSPCSTRLRAETRLTVYRSSELSGHLVDGLPLVVVQIRDK